jgi:hypothetical protein
MSELLYIIAAYTITWIVFAGYAIYADVRDAKARAGAR